MKVRKENLLAVKCEEGCQETRPYNRQSLPWGFLFCRSPEKCVLADRLAIMVNKLAYKPSVKDIMDKYHEMFRGKNSANKKDFFNSPDRQTVPTTRTRTRT